MNDGVTHSLTPLELAAAQAHEFFLAFVQAGFTEEQALRLVLGILTKRAEK